MDLDSVGANTAAGHKRRADSLTNTSGNLNAGLNEEMSVSVKKFRSSSREEILTVRSSIDQLRRNFPLDRFNYHFPPVIFRHQLYSMLPRKSRTEIDREVNVLRQRNEIRFIKFDLRGDEIALIKTEDYREHVRGYSRDRLQNPLLIERFLDMIENFEVSITTADLNKERMFSDENIQSLVKVGVLILRDVKSWWVSFPGAGQFIKTFHSGREKVLTMIRKSKYSSILETELIHRGLPKRCIGMHYAIHDIIGGDLVESANTSSGRILRYR
ncbi:serine/threonine-protein kinase 19-like [Paramacrobiotus metropolitanus]|uniref:serine/threonine-protein kinase 19-like n=1 Tax=Paramacrobiotus metropolitanus TaxID=2943436 RepID=UPI0024465462|nr:serine/threonine-protein kinase 19-like [Paramacrobiotus metropolitanus]